MKVDGSNGSHTIEEEVSMNTVQEVLEEYSDKFIILFLRNMGWTTMYKSEEFTSLRIDILERIVTRKHVFTFKNMYHIELTI